MGSPPVVKVEGDDAAKAWEAYGGKSFGFDDEAQRKHAQSLPKPDILLMHVPENKTRPTDSCPYTAEELEELGKSSSSALLLRRSRTAGTCNILFLHTRNKFRGRGLAEALLAEAKRLPGVQKLVADAAACRTYYAVCLLLRAGFMADIRLFETDIAMPGESVPASTHGIYFWWDRGASLEDQLRFVEQVRDKQRSRGTERARAFVDRLERIVEALQRRAGEYQSAASKLSRKRRAPTQEGYTGTDGVFFPLPLSTHTIKDYVNVVLRQNRIPRHCPREAEIIVRAAKYFDEVTANCGGT